MANGLDKAALDSDVRAALKKARDSGSADSAVSDNVISTLSTELATAIRSYMETAKVVTDHIIPPGHTGAGAPPATNGSAATTAPGKGKGPSMDLGSNGNLKYTNGDESTLKNDIQKAYKKARDSGSADGAVSAAVISTLAQEVCDAIHKFALKGKTETTFDVDGGVAAVGFTGPAPASAPVPAATGPGTGKADGVLS